MLRLGPDSGPTILAAPALFEEANRTRTMLLDVLRRLAGRGFACALPDLPGQGESLLPSAAANLTSWRHAFAAAASSLPGPVHVVAIRGGALVDTDAAVASRWHLAPVTGADLVRELRRIQHAAGSDDYSGNTIPDPAIALLEGATPAATRAVRVVRLDTDPRPADHRFSAAPLWRASEPGTDPALQAVLADNIAEWIATCAA